MQRPTHPPKLDDLEHDEERSSLVASVGTVIGGGVVAALAASVPPELRIGDGGSPLRAVEVWFALAAVIAPFAIVVVATFRRARHGLRILVGPSITLFAGTLLWWAVLELGLVSVFGAVLKAKTHHRGLAGVTFAFFALVTGILVALFAARGGRMLAKAGNDAHRLALGVAALAAFVALILVGARTARNEELQTASALVDLLGLSVAAAFASTSAVGRVRAVSILGVPVAAIVVAIGLAAMRDPALRAAFETHAPVHAWLIGLVSR